MPSQQSVQSRFPSHINKHDLTFEMPTQTAVDVDVVVLVEVDVDELVLLVLLELVLVEVDVDVDDVVLLEVEVEVGVLVLDVVDVDVLDEVVSHKSSGHPEQNRAHFSLRYAAVPPGPTHIEVVSVVP
jgi:hypothetical protein